MILTMKVNENFDGYNLHLSSKKLLSGKHQVKFELRNEAERRMHGYLLAEPGSTLRQIVEKIMNRVYLMQEKDQYYHGHLYSMKDFKRDDEDMLVFED